VGIFILIITYYISIGWTRKKAIKFENFDAIAIVTKKKLFPKNIVPLIIRIIVIILIVVVIAGLGIWYSGESSNQDYILVMDASGSMLADDYEPNRLEAAKNSAETFTNLLSSEAKMGVVAFAGTPLLIQSLTMDKELINDAIASIKVIETGGTAIGDAIALAVNIFEAQKKSEKARTVILLTDGQSNVGMSTDVATNYAITNGVVIHTIGIGTEEGGYFIGDKAISQIDIETLKKIASSTGGNFYLARNVEELEDTYNIIFSSTKSQVFFDSKKYILITVFLLLLIEWVLSQSKYKTIV